MMAMLLYTKLQSIQTTTSDINITSRKGPTSKPTVFSAISLFERGIVRASDTVAAVASLNSALSLAAPYK